MTARSELIAAATVGTAHRSVDLSALTEPLRPDPLRADPAVALLDAAVLSALAQLTVPPIRQAAIAAPTVAAPETVPVVPGVVRQVLSRLTTQPSTLVEALTLIHRAGQRLPPEMVPGLLDDTRAEVVAAARPVAGEIGRLLMAKNPRWAAAPPPNPADRTSWDEGTTAERTLWLRALRHQDPVAGRELLAASFSQESAGTRAELLAVLEQGLSADDQNFLLTAAGDRGRAVVAMAHTLLTRLPDSPLRQDMRTLAARHLKLRRRLLRIIPIVTEPAAAELAPWTSQDGDPWTVLLGRIDPTEWPRIFGADLLPLIAGGSEELRPLWPGFRRAAITFHHAALAGVLVAGTLTGADRTPPPIDSALWAELKPSDATALLDRLLHRRPVRSDQIAAAATAVARPWPAALAGRIARWLPTGGLAGAPAPRPMWDLWASAAALPDCRELADLARSLPVGVTGTHVPTLATRSSNAGNLLTLRAVLYETLCVPGGNQ